LNLLKNKSSHFCIFWIFQGREHHSFNQFQGKKPFKPKKLIILLKRLKKWLKIRKKSWTKLDYDPNLLDGEF